MRVWVAPVGQTAKKIVKNVDTAFGENVRRLRKERGWTQAEFAQRIGVHLNHINKIETGKYMPQFETVIEMANAFEVSLDYLAGVSTTGLDEIRIEDQTFAEKIKLLNSLEDEDRNAIIRIIDTMLTKKKMIGLLKTLEIDS